MRYLTQYDVAILRWWATQQGTTLRSVTHRKSQQKWSPNARNS